jgi:hypothetical protein
MACTLYLHREHRSVLHLKASTFSPLADLNFFCSKLFLAIIDKFVCDELNLSLYLYKVRLGLGGVGSLHVTLCKVRSLDHYDAAM